MSTDSPSKRTPEEMRVLLLPPTSRDADAMYKLLAGAEIACAICPSMAALCEMLPTGAGAIIVSEEALIADHSGLAACVLAQPVWSDMPIIVLSRSGTEAPTLGAALARLGNVSVLERPVRVTTLISMVRSALRARQRQYQVRDQFDERSRAEQALRESEERLRLGLEAGNTGTWDWDILNGQVAWSEGLFAFHGILPGQFSGKVDDFATLVHPDDADRVFEAIGRSLEERAPYRIEFRVRRPDGAVRWLTTNGRVYYDPSGRPVRMLGATSDITDRRLAEEALRESEANLRLLADAMPQIVWTARPDGVLDYYNRRWFKYIGLSETAGKEATWDRFIHPQDLPKAYETWSACLRSGDPYSIEFRVRGGDGLYRWFLARALPIRDDAGHIVHWYGTCTDVHDHKELQAQNEQLLESERGARTEAERAGMLKDEFLATLSHELRTPLNAILGWSKILSVENNGNEDLAEGLATIERNARAQAQIIEDLLDMSRIISGKVRLDVQRLDLAPVVQGALDTVRPAAEAKGVRLQAAIDPLAGPISGDPNRLQQIWWNLLSNAIKFTPKGGRVQVLLERVHSQLEVSVIDTGEGIKPEFLPHVFDRFRQADASTARRHGGLGLGLAIVKQLVELHGGSVSVSSGGVGMGSTFTVSLPITAVHAEPSPHVERRHPQSGSQNVPHNACAQIHGVRVLVVDDEPDARALVKRLLEDCHAVVTTAASAAEAFEKVQADRPDVMVSDIGMPGEDGYSLIRRVRALSPDKGGNTLAVALTAYARADDRVKAVRAGFNVHVTKPVEPAELIAMVASLAGRTQPAGIKP